MSPCVEARRARPLLGTFVEIVAQAPAQATLARAIEKAFAAVAEVHRLMSPHEPSSELCQLNELVTGETLRIHRWTRYVLEAAQFFSTESQGAFEVASPGEGSCHDLVIATDGLVNCRRPARLDFGGIAKGFAVDRATKVLQAQGVTSGLVNAGGDLRAFGRTAQLVHVRHPLRPEISAGTFALCERALASSSRCVLDGRSGAPVTSEIGATIAAADCLTADALTKVALVLREKAAPLLRRMKADAFLLERNLPPRWLARYDAS